MAFCINCGKELPEGMRFCIECGAEQTRPEPVTVAASATQEATVKEEKPEAQQQPFAPTYAEPQPEFSQPYTVYEQAGVPNMPPPMYQSPQGFPPAYNEEPRPMSGGKYSVVGTGTYFGLMILFSIPVIGFIACIIFACGAGKNENIRNFARAKLIWSLISLVITVILTVVLVVFSIEFANYSNSAQFDEFFRNFSQNPQYSYNYESSPIF